MSWRAGMNRSRNARLENRRKSSRADPVALAAPVTVAGAVPAAPAAFLGEQTREAIQELVNRGYSDGDLAQHFGGTKNAIRLRRRYLGIDSAVGQGRQPGEMPPAYGFRRDRAAERDEIETAFHLEHGKFQSFTDRQINNYEIVYAATRIKRRTVDVMPRLYGDPSPDRVRV